MSRKLRTSAHRLCVLAMVFLFLAFLLVAFRGEKTDTLGLILAVAVPGSMLVTSTFLTRVFPLDPLIMLLSHFFCGLGLLLAYLATPDQLMGLVFLYAGGLGVMLLCASAVRLLRSWTLPVFILIPVTLLILLLPVLTRRGVEVSITAPHLWSALFGHPEGMLFPALILVVCFFMSGRRFLAWFLFTISALALLMSDPSPDVALTFLVTVFCLYWASSGNIVVTLAAFAGGIFAFSLIFRSRLDQWMLYLGAPGNLLSDLPEGLSRSLTAVANAGLWGNGLGHVAANGDPVFAFTALCEQFGLIFGLITLLLYGIFIQRGAFIAMNATKGFHGLVAMGVTVLIGLRVILSIGGSLGLLPITDTALPLIGFGDSSLIGLMGAIGILHGVSSLNREALDEDLEIAMRETD